MAKQNIIIGAANAGAGDTYYTAAEKTKANFDDLYDASNITGAAKFDKPASWVGSPAAPNTGLIQLDITNAVSGGTVCVYYKGNILTKESFLPAGLVTFINGSNRLDILCAVWITYDKGSGAFHVNIQDTWTGAISEPPTDIENAPTNLVLLLEDAIGDIENAPTNLVLLEEEI